MARRYWVKGMARKIPFVEQAIDLSDEINRTIGLSKLPRELQILYHLMGPTGNRLDLIDLIQQGGNSDGNKGVKQVQGRTGKYKGHYHTVYGGNNAGASVPSIARGSSKGRKYSGKRYKKRY